MNINWTQPITAYELIAIILSTIALIIPIIKCAYNRFIKRPKIDFLPSGMITLFHNRSGSYISLGGVYEAKNKSTTVKEISSKVIRQSDNATLSLVWSTFPSPVCRTVAGNFETSFETAHPFKVEADTLAPAFVEFADKCANMDEISNDILYPVICATTPVFSQPDITLPIVDSAVRSLPEYASAKIALNDYFFWKADTYEIIMTTIHSKGSFDKKYIFSLSDEESLRLRCNIDSILVSHVAVHFGMSVQMNSVRKEFKEKSTK